MSTDDKKRQKIKTELIELGITDKEMLERLTDEIDEFAKLIIDTFKVKLKENK